MRVCGWLLNWCFCAFCFQWYQEESHNTRLLPSFTFESVTEQKEVACHYIGELQAMSKIHLKRASTFFRHLSPLTLGLVAPLLNPLQKCWTLKIASPLVWYYVPQKKPTGARASNRLWQAFWDLLFFYFPFPFFLCYGTAICRDVGGGTIICCMGHIVVVCSDNWTTGLR